MEVINVFITKLMKLFTHGIRCISNGESAPNVCG